MKHFIIILLTGLSVSVITCKENSVQPAIAATLIAKWGILNDSTYSCVGPFCNTQNYKGVAEDYFDFRADGFVYIKEGSSLDTLSYKIYSDTTITITSFGWVFNGKSTMSYIRKLTAQTVTIYAPNVINPGGFYDRTLNLRRFNLIPANGQMPD
jgi:hypothetical protein